MKTLALLFAALLLGLPASPAQEADPVPPKPALPKARVIEVGDLISLEIKEEKTGAKKLKVMQSGQVMTPHLGLVPAVGKSTEELAEIVSTGLETDYFKAATVLIGFLPKEAPKANVGDEGWKKPGSVLAGVPSVTVFGLVAKQGQYLMGLKLKTVSDVLAEAGPIQPAANRAKLRVCRKVPGDPRNRRVILNPKDDFILLPDDVLILPEKLVLE